MSFPGSKVSIPHLIALATDLSPSEARTALSRGNVYVNGVCLGVGEDVMSRVELCGARVRVGRLAFDINELGTAIVRSETSPTLLAWPLA